MTLLFADSFDHYGTGAPGLANLTKGPAVYAEVADGTYLSIDNSIKRTGLYSLKGNVAINGGSTLFRKSIVIANNEVIVGFGLYLDSLPPSSSKVCFQLLNGTTPIASLLVTSGGALRLCNGDYDDTVVEQTDNIFGAGTFNYVEFRVLRDDVVGEIECRLNGIQVALADNLNVGGTDIDGFRQYVPVNGSGVLTYVDDLIILDTTGSVNNDFPGPVRVNTVFAVADTAEADWTKNTGTDGYALIDDVAPDGDTTYIQANDVGNISEFAVGDLPAEVAEIKGVYVPAMARLADAGVGNLRVSMVSGSDVAAGPDTPVTTSYSYYGSAFETDPDGDIAWTKTSFEAALLRLEKTA